MSQSELRPSGQPEVLMNLLRTIAGPLPAELHAHHRPMFDKVEVVPAEPAILTEVNGERAIADHVWNGVPKQWTSKP